jgi:chromosome partitioning protein
MTRIIALANQKGGTGKTTTAVNLVAGLARYGQQRVLLVDLDPQANATAVFLGMAYVAGPNPGLTVYEVLTGKSEAAQAIHAIQLAETVNLDILPSHIHLAVAEQELISIFQRENQLQRALQAIQPNYDIIMIDCPPSLGLLTINALMVANEVLVPIEPGFFPLIGLGLLRKTIETIKGANPKLRLMGLLPVRVNRTNLAASTLEELTQAFGELVLSPIPERVVIGEANAHSQDIFGYAPHSDGAAAYKKLVEEVLHRG